MDGHVTEQPARFSSGSNANSSERTLALFTRIFSTGALAEYAIRLWNGTTLPPRAGGPPRFTVVLPHPGSLRGMLLPPTAANLAESFLRGEFEIEGDIVAAIGLGDGLAQRRRQLKEWIRLGAELLRLPPRPANNAVRPARARGALHSRERDRAAVQYHYDVANEFYALWLDAKLVYSCAYFPAGTENLDAAQEAKLDLICRKLRLHPDETLLDIGCGWGGLSIFAAKKYGARVLGVTLSEKQATWACEQVRAASLQNRVRIELRDYRDVTGSFDKIASIGMAEHVGRAQLSAYFARVYALLKPKGVFLNQAIAEEPCSTRQNWLTRFAEPNRFFRRHVFPDHELVPIHVTLESAALAGFEVRGLESLREHYTRTARAWLERLEARREDALLFVSERTLRLWRIYLAIVAYAFQARRLNLFQTVLVKPDPHGEYGMPLVRAG